MPMTPEERHTKRLEYQRAWAKEHPRQNRGKRETYPTSRKYVQTHSHGDRESGLPGVAEVRYMPNGWSIPDDKSINGPTVTKYPIRLGMINDHRNFDCQSYDGCLELVCGDEVGSGHKEPGGFSCRSCQYFREPEGRPIGDSSKIKKVNHRLEIEDEEDEEESQVVPDSPLVYSALHEVIESATESGTGDAIGEGKGGDIRESLGIGEEVLGGLVGDGEGAGDEAGPASCYPAPSPGVASGSSTDFAYCGPLYNSIKRSESEGLPSTEDVSG